MEAENHNKKNYWKPILFFVGIVIVTVTIIQIIGIGIDFIRLHFGLPIQENTTEKVVEIPDEEAISTSEQTDEVEAQKLFLLKNTEIYNREPINIALNGNFAKAKLNIRGEVKEVGDYFLLVDFGEISGILNGVRKGLNTLDVDATRSNGGVFSKDTPINTSIDLLSKTIFASTRKEYSENGDTLKSVSLWESNILPPTVTKLVVSPLNEKGEFKGALINQIEFEYACETGSDCEVRICPTGEKFTECLVDFFGVPAANSWCDRSGTGCSL